MPETELNRLHRRKNGSYANSQREVSGTRAGSSSRSGSTATDFTAKQQLKLRAGDFRLARLRMSMTVLQGEMQQSAKMIKKLCKDVNLDIDTDKKTV